MNNEEFKSVVDEVVVKCKKILDKKGPNYSSDGNRFDNFDAAAAMKRQTPQQALLGMSVKHTVSIHDFVDRSADHEFITKKEWEAKIFDEINYCFLLYGMLRRDGSV